jgi:hypothetical protein
VKKKKNIAKILALVNFKKDIIIIILRAFSDIRFLELLGRISFHTQDYA